MSSLRPADQKHARGSQLGLCFNAPEGASAHLFRPASRDSGTVRCCMSRHITSSQHTTPWRSVQQGSAFGKVSQTWYGHVPQQGTTKSPHAATSKVSQMLVYLEAVAMRAAILDGMSR